MMWLRVWFSTGGSKTVIIVTIAIAMHFKKTKAMKFSRQSVSNLAKHTQRIVNNIQGSIQYIMAIGSDSEMGNGRS